MYYANIERQAIVAYARNLPEAKRLPVLNLMMRDRVTAAHEATQRRVVLHRQCRELAENGRIALVESGVYFDSSRYENHVHYCPANYQSIEALADMLDRDSEGALGLYLERPSVAYKLVRS